MLRAVRLHQYCGPDVLRVEDVELRKPAGGDVLVRVRAAGINPGEVNIRAVGAGPGDTVAVSAAAGGVGSIAVQLLRLRGARVIAIASGRYAGWLQAQGATVVAYGDGAEDRIRAAALASRSKWVAPGWLWAWPRSTASKSG